MTGLDIAGVKELGVEVDVHLVLCRHAWFRGPSVEGHDRPPRRLAVNSPRRQWRCGSEVPVPPVEPPRVWSTIWCAVGAVDTALPLARPRSDIEANERAVVVFWWLRRAPR